MPEMTDRALGDAVAEKVLGEEWRDEEGLPPHVGVDWETAGLVIDKLRAEGYSVDIIDIREAVEVDIYGPYRESAPLAWTRLADPSPIRAILIAALRAKEAAT